MKIAFVSTWRAHCGIATYTEELASALIKQGHEIFVLAPAEPQSCIRDDTLKVPVSCCWTRRCDGLAERILDIVRPGVVDVVHWQHENGLFWQDDNFLGAVQQVSKVAPSVVTLHTVRHYGTWQYSGFLDGIRHCADAVVLHTPEAMASIALARSDHARLHCIPHGSDVSLADGDAAIGLGLLQIPERFRGKVTVGLCFGFQGPNKNTVATVRAFAEGMARRLIENTVLAISGDAGDTGYYTHISGAILESGYRRNFVVQPSWTRPEDVPHVMAAADFGVLNSNSPVLSSSGAAHVFARHGVPLAVANRPIYVGAIQGGAIPFEVNGSEPTLSMVNAVAALARDDSVRRCVGTQLRAWSASTSWDVVAKQHLAVYEGLKR